MKRRDFFARLAIAGALPVVSGGCVGTARVGPTPVSEAATIPELQAGMTAGQYGARSLTRVFLDRIAAVDRRGPKIRSVLRINPDALEIAAVLDQERRHQGPRGPLHGIPILLKDNLDTGDRMPTTAGSLALDGVAAPRDAFVTRRLREAGAVILGKTNLSEWANIRSPRSSSGWSAVGGQTLNPYALARSPSGSSSGSAAAVAAGLCVVAVGTETDGSVVSPSSCCSIVGLKPTVGRVSRSGIIPISRSQDTAGPMGRCVLDVAILLDGMVGRDARDPATASATGMPAPGYTEGLKPDALRGARVGVARQEFGTHEGVNRLIESQLGILKELGAELVDPVRFETRDQFGDAEFEVLLYELKTGLAEYLATRGDTVSVHTLADIIAFNERRGDREMPYFGQETFLKAEEKGPLTDEAYRKARESCIQLARVEGIEAVMTKHNLDVIVAPTEATPPWLIDPINGDHYGGGCSSLPAVAGCPHLTVPAGYVHGLPVGLSFFGRPWSEAPLLAYGFAYEHATRARRAPVFARDVAYSTPPT